MKDRPIHIKAVLFQLQGTVVQQGQLAEKKLKAGIGCPLDTPLFDYIQNLPKPAKRKQILSDLEDLELKAVTILNFKKPPAGNYEHHKRESQPTRPPEF
jgi:hypothetical protein